MLVTLLNIFTCRMYWSCEMNFVLIELGYDNYDELEL